MASGQETLEMLKEACQALKRVRQQSQSVKICIALEVSAEKSLMI
jgi:hypothetical protein